MGQTETHIDNIREFNRYYTNLLCQLNQTVLDGKFTYSEARVLREINSLGRCTIKQVSQAMIMDTGYLSRLMTRFEKQGLIRREASAEDGRSHYISLTDKGQQIFLVLVARSHERIQELIRHLTRSEVERLVQSMDSVRQLITGSRGIRLEDITLRHELRPGDVGYLTYLHGWIYSKEYGYTAALEAYVAKSFHDFLLEYDDKKDRLWLAEHGGEMIGSIGIIGEGERARLRWFLLHPDYRGVGLGKRLLGEAIDYCKQQRHKVVYLDTTNDLSQALAMYERAGFVKVAEKENHTWAEDLLELTYELALE